MTLFKAQCPPEALHSQSLFQRCKMQSLQSLITLAPSATMTMEVSYTFHSHLIGRSGQSINSLMKETGTRIHFPDRNRIAGQSKSNSVVIRGHLADLERARQRIRANVPVEFIIDCPIDHITGLGQSALSEYFSATFRVLLRFYPKIDGVNCQVNIRGQQNHMDLLKESVLHFGRVTHTPQETVVLKMETSFDHIWLARGLVDQIVSTTGAGIRLPDVSRLKELPKKYSVWIRGSMDSVYHASQMLVGLLPMQLMVQIPSNRFDHSVIKAAEAADVLFHMENSVLDTLTVRLTSYEWNACKAYEILRRCCLNDPSSSQLVPPSLPPTWTELAVFARNTFLPASERLLQETSKNTQGSAESFASVFIDLPHSSSESTSTSVSPSFGRTTVPASLTASRFDPNSSRLLSRLLETLGLTHYSDLLIRNEVDMAMFSTLNEQDLISIGISSFGARKIMLNAIKAPNLIMCAVQSETPMRDRLFFVKTRNFIFVTQESIRPFS